MLFTKMKLQANFNNTTAYIAKSLTDNIYSFLFLTIMPSEYPDVIAGYTEKCCVFVS